MRKFPHTNAQFIAVLVFAVGALSALAVLQNYSSLGGYLKAVPVGKDGVCYVSRPTGEAGAIETSCTNVESLDACPPPGIFVPGGRCTSASTANSCEQAGIEIVSATGEGTAATEEESHTLAQKQCQENLVAKTTLRCPAGCGAYLKYYVEQTCKTAPTSAGDQSYTQCICRGVVACTSTQGGAVPPAPIPVPAPPPSPSEPAPVFRLPR